MHLKIGSLFIVLLIITGCRQMDYQQDIHILMDVDRAFSKMSSEKGIFEAFKFYADDGAVLYRDLQPPFSGKQAIIELMENSTGTLVWEPFKAEISQSRDLGYTLGKYEYTTANENGDEKKSYGYYVSIWKRQEDGNWKYVFDSGIRSPERLELSE